MKRVAELNLFLMLAIGLHLVVATLGPKAEEAHSAGRSGTSVLSLQAASAQVSGLAERWETPPEAGDISLEAMPDTPPPPDAAPLPPDLIEAARVVVPPIAGLSVPQFDTAPFQTDTAPAAPSCLQCRRVGAHGKRPARVATRKPDAPARR